MVKHLFRVNFVNPTNQEDRDLVEVAESFIQTDRAISLHINVHVLDIPVSEARKKEIFQYGRDLITEWGNTLYVTPELVNRFPLSLVRDSAFEKMMEQLGYKKKISPNNTLSEGGLYVIGQEFIFISDVYESQSRKFERVVKNTGLDIPIYFMPSLTSTDAAHIDCDYQVVDSLRLIYGGHNVFRGDTEEDNKARSRLEEIASIHNFDMREYRFDEETLPDLDLNDPDIEASKRINGINFIVNKVLLTGYMPPEEQEYLHKRGLEVVTAPLGKVEFGAGLKCIYGEFNL